MEKKSVSKLKEAVLTVLQEEFGIENIRRIDINVRGEEGFELKTTYEAKWKEPISVSDPQ